MRFRAADSAGSWHIPPINLNQSNCISDSVSTPPESDGGAFACTHIYPIHFGESAQRANLNILLISEKVLL